MRDAVSALRQIRSDYNIAPGKTVDAVIVATGDERGIYEQESALVGRLARCAMTLADRAPGEAAAHALLPGGASVVVPLAGLVDVARECEKLRGELAQLEKQLGSLEQRLANPSFTERAPAAVVEGERTKAREWTDRRDQLREKVRSLCGA